ncbi:MAG: STAS domain-containing protein [Thermostichales cyanobacterium DRC_bins_46]
MRISTNRAEEDTVISEPLTLTVSLRGSHEIRDNCHLVHLTGMLDAFSDPNFRKALSKIVQDPPPNLILDLTGVEFIDSTGVGALVQVAKQVKEQGGIFQIVSNPRVNQIVKLVRLQDFLCLQNSLEEALARLHPSPPA